MAWAESCSILTPSCAESGRGSKWLQFVGRRQLIVPHLQVAELLRLSASWLIIFLSPLLPPTSHSLGFISETSRLRDIIYLDPESNRVFLSCVCARPTCYRRADGWSGLHRVATLTLFTHVLIIFGIIVPSWSYRSSLLSPFDIDYAFHADESCECVDKADQTLDPHFEICLTRCQCSWKQLFHFIFPLSQQQPFFLAIKPRITKCDDLESI